MILVFQSYANDLLIPAFDKQNWSYMRACKGFTDFVIYLKTCSLLLGLEKGIFDLVRPIIKAAPWFYVKFGRVVV